MSNLVSVAEQHISRDRFGAPLTTRPSACCPTHPNQTLEGGPIKYRCPAGHGVAAADITREVTW